MTAIVKPVESAQDALPVCLASWRQNPYRLVSLWEIMKPFQTHLFLTEVLMLEKVWMLETMMGTGVGCGQVEEYSKVKMQPIFRDAAIICAELGLTASRVSAEKLTRLVSESDCSSDKLRELVREYQKRLIDEMSAPRFLSLTDEEASYYNNPTEGWREVVGRFPSAITDIEEMNKCFALSRYAATVFHSVQVIECGLLEFGKFLNVNDPKSGWTAVSARLITLATKTKYPDLDPLYQKHFEFIE